MAEKETSRGSSSKWSLSKVWRPPSNHTLFSLDERMGNSEEDGISPEWFTKSPQKQSRPTFRAPHPPPPPPPTFNTSRPPLSYPMHSDKIPGLHFPSDAQTQNRGEPQIMNDGCSSYYGDEKSVYDIEMDAQGKLKHDDDEEAGVLGLVRPEATKRHSETMKAAYARSRPNMLQRLSSEYASRRFSRQQSRTSRILSPLPRMEDYEGDGDWPLSPHNQSFMGSTVSASVHEGQYSEKTPVPAPPPLAVHPAFVVPDPNLVVWEGPNDKGNPMNWSRSKKWASTMALGFMTFCVTFASSVFSPGTETAAKHFNTSSEVMTLATALFVLGFAFGPIVWGPFSEIYGRKIPLFTGLAVFAIFQIPVAVAPNLLTLLICRFLGGFFGCAPLSIVGGALADFWAPVDRGVAVSIFSGATFLGPTLGPIVCGYLVETPGYGWRWTAWVTLMATALFGTIGFFVYQESFAPVLLQRRAKQRRHATKNWAIHAPADEISISPKVILGKYLTKPFLMLIYEPILLLMTIYISFIYGILYLFFETYPLSFHLQRGWGLGQSGLPFAAVMVGVVLGGLVNFAFVKTRYVRILKTKGSVPPEERLVPMMVGAVALPAGLFWYAWTSSPDINPWIQISAGVPCGMGIVLIFLQGLNYIIDCYMMYSNSAIAGNTFIRSAFGAGFPMFAVYMYKDLGIVWATTLLGGIAVALMPVPVLFFIFGARIRKLSKFVPQLPPGGMGPGGPPAVAQGNTPPVPGATPAPTGPPVVPQRPNETERPGNTTQAADAVDAASRPGTAIAMPAPVVRY